MRVGDERARMAVEKGVRRLGGAEVRKIRRGGLGWEEEDLRRDGSGRRDKVEAAMVGWNEEQITFGLKEGEIHIGVKWEVCVFSPTFSGHSLVLPSSVLVSVKGEDQPALG